MFVNSLLYSSLLHRFKGTESTFGHFPERLRHILSETVANVVVESVVFPSYEASPSQSSAFLYLTSSIALSDKG